MHVSETVHLASAENLDLPSFSFTVARFYPDLLQPISQKLCIQDHMQTICSTQLKVLLRHAISYEAAQFITDSYKTKIGWNGKEVFISRKKELGEIIFDSHNHHCFASSYVLKLTATSL